MTVERRYKTEDELAEELAESVATSLRRALSERGTAALAVPGGSTPRAFLLELGRHDLDWRAVHVTLTDERWVDATDPRSNEALLRETLLQGRARDAQVVGLWSDAATPEEGLQETEARLQGLPRPFDVVVVGMGTDGHTASLFPDAPGTAEGLDPTRPELCVAVRPEAQEPRISLTLSALVTGRRHILLIAGPEKWSVYRSLGPELPAALLLRATEPTMEVHWAE